MKDKQPLTYTVGDTAFGEVLQDLTEKKQNPGENRDKSNGGRRPVSTRKVKTMDPKISEQTQEKGIVAPAGGKGRDFLSTVGTGAKDLAYDGARGVAVGTGAAIGAVAIYWGAKALGAPLP